MLLLRLFEAIPLPSRSRIFEGVMLAIHAFDRKHRAIARVNLKIAFPGMGEGEARRIVRECYRLMGVSAAEFVELPRMDRSYVDGHVRIEGLEHVSERMFGENLGFLGLTGHFGNWEVMVNAFAQLVRPVSFLVRPLKDPTLDRIVEERRSLAGNRPLRKFDSAREVMKIIREGGVVGILADQNVTASNGIPVDFFGLPAYTTHGIARLALALRTPIHPFFIFREPGRKFHHVIRVGPALPMDPAAPREEEVLRLTRLCNAEVEKAIRTQPDQWLWLHRRWKTRPPGEPNPYGGIR
jgi:KDO2-lipid IV(A) lauroyltransferase